MKTAVIGGAGFIGSHVVEELERQGHEVLVLDNLSTGKRENLAGTQARFHLTAIRDSHALKSHLQFFQPQNIIHLAAQSAIGSSFQDPRYDMEVNILGTLNVILTAKLCGVEKLVFSSTSAVYKPTQDVLTEDSVTGPDTPYGISKLAAEGYLRALCDNAVILRFGNVYGPRQVPLGENQVIARAIQHLEQGTPFSIHGSGEQTRSYVYVKDVARACVMALESKPNTYNICTMNSYSVNTVADVLSLIYDITLGEWHHDDETDTRGDVRMSPLSAMTELGWAASTPLMDGLRETVNWWRNG